MWVPGWPSSFLAVTVLGIPCQVIPKKTGFTWNGMLYSPLLQPSGFASPSWGAGAARRSRTSGRWQHLATDPACQQQHGLAGSLAARMVIAVDHGKTLDSGKISLWLDMRTAVLPAQPTLQRLYDDLRARELARGRSPDDEDWTLRRVPNPVGALVYADEPRGRAKGDFEELQGALRCFEVDVAGRVTDVKTDVIAGAGLDPALSEGQGPNSAIDAAVQGVGELVLLLAVRPSCWADEDMPNFLRMTASACTGAGKILVVTVRTTGQLNEAAMAALSASQTTLLGDAGAGGGVALLLEPEAELWETGMLYL